MGKLSFSVIILVVALLIHVFYPSLVHLASGGTEAPGTSAGVHSIPANSPLNRFYDLIGPLLKLILSYFSRVHPLEGTLKLEGLEGEVKVIMDEWGVPHIYADSKNDGALAQGYIHAHERLFQMDFNRYLGQGRLAELFGSVAVSTDHFLRSLGFNKRGPEFANMEPAFQKYIESYVQGINQYLTSPLYSAPIEYTILGMKKPEPWTPADVVRLGYLINWEMTLGWNFEISRSAIQDIAGDHFHELDNKYHPTHPSIAEDPFEYNLIKDGSWVSSFSPFLKKLKASNNYVISGNLTESGGVIVCNDPHLPLTTPSFWYQAHIVSGGHQVSGAAIVGLPAVIIGHNEDIAWGYTLSFVDSEDLVLEKLHESKPLYEFKGEWLPLDVEMQTIQVKDGESVEVAIRRTRNGPIISDTLGLKKDVSLRSLILNIPVNFFQALLGVSESHSWEEFAYNAANMHVSLNVVYGDIKGNYGYWLSGSVPKRVGEGYDGGSPVPGWTGEFEWNGNITGFEMPHLFNPKKGYVTTSNNRIVPEDHPFFFSTITANGFRSARIKQVLDEWIEQGKKLTIDRLLSLQNDITSLAAIEVVGILKRLDAAISKKLASEPLALSAWKLLVDFDGVIDKKSPTATIYEVFRYFYLRHILEPQLGEDLTHTLLGKGVHPTLASPSELHHYDVVTLIALMNNSSSWWVNKAGGSETVIVNTITDTSLWLSRELGGDITQWQYGKIHTVTMEHVLGGVPPLDRVFSVGPYPMSGDGETVQLAGMATQDPYHVGAWATHYRYCVDLADIDNGQTIHAPGQSGNLGDKHYDDLLPLWINADYHQMLWSKESVELHKESEMVLVPKN
eukprot:TRINITY_DN10535_c0_g1_i1.p1 TRINITY_DN10535_c0_g1~~TRINITY_DN10535_c0_g1_i1.p1  ORF type:complete len:845 (+),score=194.23 TRINITY_DN10535_c0_g1_i1:113-2647(+)